GIQPHVLLAADRPLSELRSSTDCARRVPTRPRSCRFQPRAAVAPAAGGEPESRDASCPRLRGHGPPIGCRAALLFGRSGAVVSMGSDSEGHSTADPAARGGADSTVGGTI